MFASDPHCTAATVDRSGRRYDNDRSGLITVSDPKDVAHLKAGGYVIAGGMPKLATYWLCGCGWEAAINSCPKCGRTDLTKVTA
jgi:hypothetical protein